MRLGWQRAKHARRPVGVALVAGVVCLVLGGVAIAQSATTGEVGPSLNLTGNGHLLRPAGRLTTVGDFPTGSAVLPGGRFLWVADCGHGEDDIKVVALATGAVVQTLPLPGCYGGVAFAPDGHRAYVSGTPKGSSPTEGPTQGDQGDVIHIFAVDPATGTGTEQTPLQLPATAGGSGRLNSLPPVSGVGTAQPEGLAVSPDGHYLVVALNAADDAVVVDLRSLTQTVVAVGQYPCDVAFDPQGRVYVSNEYAGTVSVIDPVTANVTATIAGFGGSLGDPGSHPEGMVADPRRPALYVAVTGRDTVDVVDTTHDTIAHVISVGRSQGLGTEPTKLAISPDDRTLYASDAGEDALAAISLDRRPGAGSATAGYIPNLPAFRLIGRIPTAAYPDDVQTTPQGQLIWIAGKGFGSGPNPTYYFGGAHTPYQTPPNAYGTYVLDLLIGRVGALTVPTDRQVVADTPIADAQARPSNSESQPAGSPIPAVTGQPSGQIKHVFYIVRENRTYDQVFGSDPRGDGKAGLELFDDNGVSGPTGGITPNAHALAHQFPLLDHFYEDSEVSVDGHLITTGVTATDYVQKATAANYSNRRGTYDFGIYPVTFPPKFFIFDQAAKQGVSFRDYGEAVGTSPTGAAPNRPEFAKVEQGVDPSYPNNLLIGCLQAGNPASCTQDSGIYNGTGTLSAGQSRFDEWYPQFEAQAGSGTVPTLNYMILPNDHTDGTTPNDPTPQAMIADNDLALGQIVDAISHSSIWPSTAIFVVEDDSQDGADHVDSHRSPAFVISPWARHGAVVGTRYDQYSALRTIELISGLHPLSLNDALATPMYDTFISGSQKPDDTPYTVRSPAYSLTTRNTSSSPLAGLSRELPWNRLDAVPQAISDQILWASVHGAGSSPPAAGPNASPDEVDRAMIVRQMLRQSPTVFEQGPRRIVHLTGGHAAAACPITWACRPAPPGDG
jgi:YVTN family beta-propeller protein